MKTILKYLRIPAKATTLQALAIAAVASFSTSCITTRTAQNIGTVTGAAAGAGAGYLLGKQRGKGGQGAVIGGIAGAGAGRKLLGDALDGDGSVYKIEKGVE